MPTEPTTPGIARENRISDEGLQRLDKQLRCGAKINSAVLTQWIRRYGDAAREVMQNHGVKPPE